MNRKSEEQSERHGQTYRRKPCNVGAAGRPQFRAVARVCSQFATRSFRHRCRRKFRERCLRPRFSLIAFFRSLRQRQLTDRRVGRKLARQLPLGCWRAADSEERRAERGRNRRNGSFSS